MTTLNPNLILKATETDMKQEYIDETFWDAIALDASIEQEEMDVAPASVMNKKTKILKLGKQYIEFGVVRQLDGEGTYEDETLSGSEEPIEQNDNAVYFTSLRHGVPFPLKGLESHYLEAFNLLQQRQSLLATWNARVSEEWHWQAFFKGCPDKVYDKFSSVSPQSYHPSMYTLDSASVTKIAWNAAPATYETAIDTAIAAQTTGDNVSYENFIDLESAAADLHIRKVPVKINGTTEMLWLWMYPRAARKRIKVELKDYFLSGDVRGPANMAFRGDKFKMGKFLFCESAYIPRILQTGSGTVTLQGAFTYNATTNKRGDTRTSTKGLMHAILGADSLCMSEPNAIEYDFERKDYKAKEGIGTYRLFGSRRMESFDNRNSITEVLNQSSIAVVENNG